MKKVLLSIILFSAVAILASAGPMSEGLREPSFEEKREEVLSELTLAIEDAEAQGKYKCCIDPPCTMCYLGNWIWDDGTCDCDGMIAKGEFDKVCPQCKSGLEEGLCKSTVDEACDPDNEEIFRSAT